jgi:hypothetical protein
MTCNFHPVQQRYEIQWCQFAGCMSTHRLSLLGLVHGITLQETPLCMLCRLS